MPLPSNPDKVSSPTKLEKLVTEELCSKPSVPKELLRPRDMPTSRLSTPLSSPSLTTAELSSTIDSSPHLEMPSSSPRPVCNPLSSPDSESSKPPSKVLPTVMVPSSSSSLRLLRNLWKSTPIRPSSKDSSTSWTELRRTWKWPKPWREMLREPDKLTTKSSSVRFKINSCTPKDKSSTSTPPSLPSKTELLP